MVESSLHRARTEGERPGRGERPWWLGPGCPNEGSEKCSDPRCILKMGLPEFPDGKTRGVREEELRLAVRFGVRN